MRADADATPSFRLQLIGAFRLSCDGRTIPLRRREQRLVALLAVKGAMCRADAAENLWPDVPDRQARACLRSAVSRVNRQVHLLQREFDVLSLRAMDVDYLNLTAWSLAMLRAEPSQRVDPQPHVVDLGLLPGWEDEWLFMPREELRLSTLGALEMEASRLLVHGQLAMASSLARTAARLDPLRESSARILIEISIREGNTSAALAEYRRIERLVYAETGGSPHQSLTALVASIQTGQRVPDVTRVHEYRREPGRKARVFDGEIATRPAVIEAT